MKSTTKNVGRTVSREHLGSPFIYNDETHLTEIKATGVVRPVTRALAIKRMQNGEPLFINDDISSEKVDLLKNVERSVKDFKNKHDFITEG